MSSRGVFGPTFQEDPVLCEVDLAHDPKAYPAEQVTRDWSLERERERLCPVSRLALYTNMYTCMYVRMYLCTYVSMYVIMRKRETLSD